MTPSDRAFYLAIKASYWLNPLVLVAGLAICIWAYRVCRKDGYLFVAVYFFLAAGGLLFGPTIKHALEQRSTGQTELSPEAEQRYQKELFALHQKYYPSAPAASLLDIHFPIGPIVLVLGLWILARRDCKGITEPGALTNDLP